MNFVVKAFLVTRQSISLSSIAPGIRHRTG
jgi:hypothetical protein